MKYYKNVVKKQQFGKASSDIEVDNSLDQKHGGPRLIA